MTTRDRVLQEFLTLPPEDQLYVAEQIDEQVERMLHPPVAPEDVMSGEEFAAEILRRSDAYERGETTARDWKDVIADMRRKQANGE